MESRRLPWLSDNSAETHSASRKTSSRNDLFRLGPESLTAVWSIRTHFNEYNLDDQLFSPVARLSCLFFDCYRVG